MEACAVVRVVRARIEVETGIRELEEEVFSQSVSKRCRSEQLTLCGVICLCGQFNGFAAPRPAVEPRFLVILRKDARRPSYVPYFSMAAMLCDGL